MGAQTIADGYRGSQHQSLAMQEAFAIFEGGGGKGLAHVGALSCALDNGIKLRGVAGASAGAIVSSLVACGYQPSELFNPAFDDAEAIYSTSLKAILGLDDEAMWRRFEAAVAAAKDLAPKKSEKTSMPRMAWRIWRFSRNHKEIVSALTKDFGVFDTAALERLLNTMLVKGLLKSDLEKARATGFTDEPGQATRPVLFKDVPLPLKIVATDIDQKRLIVFSQERTPEIPVAEAVAASVSLPIVFRPKRVRYPNEDGSETVLRAIDGGLLSNFPAWLFDSEREQVGPHVPTLGFRLVETPKDDQGDFSEMAAYLGQVVGVVVNGDPLLEKREIENLHEIPLKVTFSTLDFDLTYDQKRKLYKEGLDSALAVVGSPGFPKDRTAIEGLLRDIVDLFRVVFGVDDRTMLRANIVCQTTRKTLRVTYTYNMDSMVDSDDRLEFVLDGGASGQCWASKAVVACDLEDARDNLADWKMDKYQRAKVRTDLKALLCHPILDEDGAVLGVLNIDSTDLGILSLLDDAEAADEFRTRAIPQLSELLLRRPKEA